MIGDEIPTGSEEKCALKKEETQWNERARARGAALREIRRASVPGRELQVARHRGVPERGRRCALRLRQVEGCDDDRGGQRLCRCGATDQKEACQGHPDRASDAQVERRDGHALANVDTERAGSIWERHLLRRGPSASTAVDDGGELAHAGVLVPASGDDVRDLEANAGAFSEVGRVIQHDELPRQREIVVHPEVYVA